ncbi:MAG TPA: FAD-dependent oxidoreductase [Acidobacteriaceae bacterium]|nr:FAD-dependent oxidoreductase [Acidobacteriaceae bacterium]
MFQIEELKQFPLMSCLPELQLQRLARGAADLHLNPGEWLIREGEEAWFFMLIEGAVEVLKELTGKQQVIAKYKAGDFFGEVPILLGASALASVRAKDRSRVMRIDRVLFKELLDSSKDCRALVMEAMTSRLNRLQDKILDIPIARVLVVGSQYDTDCRDIRSFLSVNRIPYEWVDRERDSDRIPACMPRDLTGPAVIVDHAFCVGQPPTVRKVAAALGYRTEPRSDGYDVVVVGAGPAGLAAAVYGASEGLKVLLIERGAVGGQAGTSSRIENYLGFPSGISGDELSERAVRQAIGFGTEIVMTREVQNLEAIEGGWCVELDEGKRVSARSVILATGVDWRRLEAEGTDRLIGRGVLYGASRTEAQTVVGKDVFIVGGGNSAGQAAMFFSSYANSVTVLVRGAGLKLTMSTYLIDQIKARPNISVEPYTQVVSVGGESSLETICTVTGNEAPRTRQADALFVMIGANAQTGWLPEELERDELGYVCTGRDLPGWADEERNPYPLETNLPGLFCVGDVRHASIKRVSSGVGEGSMAIAFVHQYLALQSASAPLLVAAD